VYYFCYSDLWQLWQSCNNRWKTRKADMSTKTEESDYFDTSGGLINSYQESNPLFWNYNRVRAHYCSSDSWLGRIEFNATGWMWAFQGANIALGIVDDLMKDPEFKQAESVVFSGIRFCFILLKFFFCIFVWVSNFAVAVLEASEY